MGASSSPFHGSLLLRSSHVLAFGQHPSRYGHSESDGQESDISNESYRDAGTLLSLVRPSTFIVGRPSPSGHSASEQAPRQLSPLHVRSHTRDVLVQCRRAAHSSECSTRPSRQSLAARCRYHALDPASRKSTPGLTLLSARDALRRENTRTRRNPSLHRPMRLANQYAQREDLSGIVLLVQLRHSA